MKIVLKIGGILLVGACAIGTIVFFVAGPKPPAAANGVAATRN